MSSRPSALPAAAIVALLAVQACHSEIETPPVPITEVVTAEVLASFPDRARVSGEITIRGDAAVADHGFVWALHPGPTLGDSRLSLGPVAVTMVFEGLITQLEPATTYHVRSFAQPQGGDAVFGNERSFTTLAEDTWVERSGLTSGPLAGGVSFVVKERLYVGTGLRTGFTSSFYEYDPLRDAWREVAPLPAAARSYALAFAIGDFGYVGLGSSWGDKWSYYNDLWRYDATTDSWTRMADLPSRGRAFSVAFVLGGSAYVTHGSTVDDRELWRYTAATDTWARLADYPGACTSRGTAIALGNRGYVGLGWSDDSCDDLWEYDPDADAWTRKASFPGGPRHDALGFAIGDRGFVACGLYQQSLDALEYKTDLWAYDPASDAWTRVEAAYVGHGRIEMIQGVVEGSVFMGLGASQAHHGPAERFADLWEYVPARPFR